jgi:catechol 2,3-dioxygenase-like lactoylglutathione lyase family enzyme
MNLQHVGLTCSSEENADKFYETLLGLKKSAPKTLPSSLSKAIFKIDSDLTMVNYMNESVRFEIFIHGRQQSNNSRIDHVCLEVNDLEEFLQRCRSLNVKFMQVPKGESTVTFVSDDDGNLFEMKQK